MKSLPAVVVAAVSVAALGVGGMLAAAPASAVEPSIRITEWEYNSPNGSEFAEFTNTGSTAVDLTGWSFDDSHRVVGKLDLSSLGTIGAGESFLLTDVTPALFRDDWGLPDTVKVLQNTVDNLGNGDEINIYDGSTLVDRLTYASDKKTQTNSAWVQQADLGTTPQNANNAVVSTVGDASGAWQSKSGSIGSPGVSQFGNAFRWVRVNEVTEDGPDTVELVNLSSLPVDVTGWQQNDSSHTPAAIGLPAGTTIPAHGYLTFASIYGLGSGDGAYVYLADGTTLVDSVSWTTTAASPGYGRCPDSTGDFATETTTTFGSANDCTTGGGGGGGGGGGTPVDPNWADVKINEVTSSNKADVPSQPYDDEIELVNTADVPVDVTGWTQTDSGHTPTAITLDGGSTSIPAHGYATFPSTQGLSSAGDAVRLYLPDATTLVDSVTWGANDAEYPGSLARCPDATGDFEHLLNSSWGADNTTACGEGSVPLTGPSGVPCQTEAPSGTGPAIADGVSWPGSQVWNVSDAQCSFVTTGDYGSGQDVSGLDFDPQHPDTLWAVKNKSHVYQLQKSGGLWTSVTTNDWSSGKDITFTGGAGHPDSEGLTIAPATADTGTDSTAESIYTTTERDNGANTVSLDTVLEFDPSQTGTTLTPVHEWDLTADFVPSVLAASGADANLGFEGITWVPDSYLTSNGFIDESTSATYDPSDYPLHGSGLYFLALEKTGGSYAYALNSDGTFDRVATISTGMPAIAETQWDPDLQRIWAVADNTSSGSTELLGIDSTGHFGVDAVYNRPTGLPNDNLEGFAVAPVSTAVGGEREVVRSDDGNNGGHSLWSGTLDVSLTLPAQGRASHTLTFDANGGGDVAPETAFDGDLFAQPTAPARTGYLFGGWYPNAQGTGDAWDFSTDTLTADQTLTAKWTPISYQIAYSANAGTGVLANQTVAYDQTVALRTSTLVRNGYTFSGWATSSTGPVVYTDGQTVSNLTTVDGATITLYAVWTPVTVASERISGTDRFDTSVQLAQAGYPHGAPVVYLATGVTFPDALGAAPAAAKQGGPLLLTQPGSVPAGVLAEIQTLAPAKVVIVGGLAAVSQAVQTQVHAALPSASITRIAGADRYETARMVIASAFTSASKVYVATGTNFPDALSASADGAGAAPVVLVNGAAGSLDQATKNLISALHPTKGVVVGGTASVSTGIQSSLASLVGGSTHVSRAGGADRFATSVLLAGDAYAHADTAYLATGIDFPDALAGAALAAAQHAPLMTVQTSCVPQLVRDELTALGVTSVTLIGGANALGSSVASLTSCSPAPASARGIR